MRLAACSLIFVATLVSPFTHALSLNLIPVTPVLDLTPGDIVTFDITLDFTEDPTLGGGLDLTFDESQLQLIGFTDEPFIGMPEFYRAPDYVPGSGLLEGWAVGSFNSLSTGLVASVSFEVQIGATTTVVALGPTNSIAGPWFSASDFFCCQDPDYGAVTVSTVPLPAGIWLLFSGLASFGLARSRAR